MEPSSREDPMLKEDGNKEGRDKTDTIADGNIEDTLILVDALNALDMKPFIEILMQAAFPRK